MNRTVTWAVVAAVLALAPAQATARPRDQKDARQRQDRPRVERPGDQRHGLRDRIEARCGRMDEAQRAHALAILRAIRSGLATIENDAGLKEALKDLPAGRRQAIDRLWGRIKARVDGAIERLEGPKKEKGAAEKKREGCDRHDPGRPHRGRGQGWI